MSRTAWYGASKSKELYEQEMDTQLPKENVRWHNLNSTVYIEPTLANLLERSEEMPSK